MGQEEKAIKNTQKAFHKRELATLLATRGPPAAARPRVPARRQRKQKTYGAGLIGPPRRPNVQGQPPNYNMAPSLLGDANGGAGDPTSGVAVIDADDARKGMIQMMSDPFCDVINPRWPDPNTMMMTLVGKDVVHNQFPIWGGATNNDGAAGMYFRGDPFKTYSLVSSIGAASSSYPLTWAVPNVSMNAAIAAGGYARPTACAVRFTFNAVGPYHSLIMRFMELPPWGPIASGFANFPAAANNGPTYIQREFFRGREVTLNPGESVQINLYPIETRCTAFASVSVERDQFATGTVNPATLSWGGFVMWCYGLSSLDQLYYDAIIRHEYYYPVPTTLTSIPTTQRAVVMPSAAEKDKVMGAALKRSVSGWNVFKNIVSGIASVASFVAPFLLDNVSHAAPQPVLAMAGRAANRWGESRLNALERARYQSNGTPTVSYIAPLAAHAIVPTYDQSVPFMTWTSTAAPPPHYPDFKIDSIEAFDRYSTLIRQLRDDDKKVEESKSNDQFRDSPHHSMSSSSGGGDGRGLDLPLSGRTLAPISSAVRKL